VKHDGFVRDILAAPERLAACLDAYDDASTLDDLAGARRVVMTGMGSSRFAALPATALLRSRGVDAVAELSSTGLPTRPATELVAVAISASGSTPETVDALARHRGVSRTVAVTNDPDRLATAATTYTIAPAERLSSALQSALMLREGPRLSADATETGDWLHVDVYLSKRPGYTALLFPGSRFDDGVMAYARERGSAIVAIGPTLGGAAQHVPLDGTDDPLVALLVETGVTELVAAELWRRGVDRADPALVP